MAASRVTQLIRYPVKSLDGELLQTAELLPNGALVGDRRWALVDGDGKFINTKRFGVLPQVRTSWLPQGEGAVGRFWLHGNEARAIELDLRSETDRRQLTELVSSLVGEDANLVEDTAGGFPDDTSAPGFTLISTATLEAVATWFPGLSVDEVRRRFRANVEVDGLPAFGEDRLAPPDAAEGRAFRLGDLAFEGLKACKRCSVPARDSYTGESRKAFTRDFQTARRATLPEWAPKELFAETGFRLALCTRGYELPESAMLELGMPLSTT